MLPDGAVVGFFSDGEFLVSVRIPEEMRPWFMAQLSTNIPNAYRTGTYVVGYYNSRYYDVYNMEGDTFLNRFLWPTIHTILNTPPLIGAPLGVFTAGEFTADPALSTTLQDWLVAHFALSPFNIDLDQARGLDRTRAYEVFYLNELYYKLVNGDFSTRIPWLTTTMFNYSPAILSPWTYLGSFTGLYDLALNELGERLHTKIEVIVNILKERIYAGEDVSFYYWTEDAVVTLSNTGQLGTPVMFRPCVMPLYDVSADDAEYIIRTFAGDELFTLLPEPEGQVP